MKWTLLAQAGVLLVFSGGVRGQDQPMDALQVRSLAATCAACHGTQGMAQPGMAQPGMAQPGMAQPGMASLAGTSKEALLQKMLDFKTGKEAATLMHQIARGYSDAQLGALAAYFSSAR